MKHTGLVICFFILINNCCVITIAVREPSFAELKCLEACQVEKHRYCAWPPDKCGRCLSAYTEVDGYCLSLTDVSDARHQHVADIKKDAVVAGSEKLPTHSLVEEQIKLMLPNGNKYQQREMGDSPASASSMEPYDDSADEIILIAVVICCSVALIIGIIIAVICWCRLRNMTKSVSEVEYTAYGSTGSYQPAFGTSSERKMAQSAQMFHYQHQKQQMLELEKTNGDAYKANSEPSSDGENEEEYTVYEYPGLATPSEMEVRNPLYMESPAPVNGLKSVTTSLPSAPNLE